jgi:hypothetical protein
MASAIDNLERHLLHRLLQPVRDCGGIARSNRVSGFEQIHIRRVRDFRSVLAERPDLIEDVEAAPMGCDGDVVAFDPDVVDGRVWQVERKRSPVIAVVHRQVEAVLRPRVEHAAAHRILPHNVRVVARRDAVDNLRPGAAEIVRPEYVRREVTEQRLLDGDVRGAGIEHGRVDLADAPEVGHVFRCDVRPRFAAVAGDMYESIVGARPDDVYIGLARSDRKHRGVDFRTVHVVRNRPSRLGHRLRIVPGEVVADPVPRLAAVGRLPDVLRRGVEDVRIDG